MGENTAPAQLCAPLDNVRTDIYNVGVLVEEMAQAVPERMKSYRSREEATRALDLAPTAARQLDKKWSHQMHDFVKLCTGEPMERPPAHEILLHPFILNRVVRKQNQWRVSHIARAFEESCRLTKKA